MNNNNEWRQANRLDRVLTEQDNEFADVKKYGELLTEVEVDMSQSQSTQPVQSTQGSAYVQPSEQAPMYQPQQQSAQQSVQQPAQQPMQQSAQQPQRQPPQQQQQPQNATQKHDDVPF